MPPPPCPGFSASNGQGWWNCFKIANPSTISAPATIPGDCIACCPPPFSKVSSTTFLPNYVRGGAVNILSTARAGT